jgi:hypothetical protein
MTAEHEAVIAAAIKAAESEESARLESSQQAEKKEKENKKSKIPEFRKSLLGLGIETPDSIDRCAFAIRGHDREIILSRREERNFFVPTTLYTSLDSSPDLRLSAWQQCPGCRRYAVYAGAVNSLADLGRASMAEMTLCSECEPREVDVEAERHKEITKLLTAIGGDLDIEHQQNAARHEDFMRRLDRMLSVRAA